MKKDIKRFFCPVVISAGFFMENFTCPHFEVFYE